MSLCLGIRSDPRSLILLAPWGACRQLSALCYFSHQALQRPLRFQPAYYVPEQGRPIGKAPVLLAEDEGQVQAQQRLLQLLGLEYQANGLQSGPMLSVLPLS